MSWLLAAALAVVSLLAHSSTSHAASAGRTVVIAHAAMNARVAPLWVARPVLQGLVRP